MKLEIIQGWVYWPSPSGQTDIKYEFWITLNGQTLEKTGFLLTLPEFPDIPPKFRGFLIKEIAEVPNETQIEIELRWSTRKIQLCYSKIEDLGTTDFLGRCLSDDNGKEFYVGSVKRL